MPLATPPLLSVTDVLHGVPVADPYRWLEDRSSSETEAWIGKQRQLYDNYLSQVPGIDSIRARVESCLDIETHEQPARIGDRCFFRRRKKGQEQACLWLRNLQSGAERILVDPSPLGPFASVTIHRISDDGGILAYEQRIGGEKMACIYFVDVASGRHLGERLDTGYVRGLAFDSDNMGYYYCHETAKDLEQHHPHEIRYHHIGTPVASDQVLFVMQRLGRSRMLLLSDDRYLGAVLYHEKDGELRVDLHRAARSTDRFWMPVFRDHMAPCGPAFHDGRMFVYSLTAAPLGHILELNEDGSEGRVIVPEWQASVRDLRFFGNRILVTYLVNLEPTVHIWSLGGTFLGELTTPKGGSFALLRAYSNHPGALFSTYESFHQPSSTLEFDERFFAWRVWAQRDGVLDRRDFEVRRVAYRSKDGTAIPMFLVMSGKGDLSIPRAAILTAYGGFGTSITPRFSALVAIMLELGAVFALPNIRGGGEFGKPWHEAARGRYRQLAFDDFIAAAEWLQDQRITSPERTAIFGGSNSGLLVGAAMTQRPDLFQAVLCIAPLLDMVRYESFRDAGRFKAEYGTVGNVEDFRALCAYSPYHRVADDVNYPATLFVTGDKDSICDPAHTLKMAARLQGRNVQSNPILVDYSLNRGHTPVLPLSVRVDALTRRIAFLCHHLKISIPAGGPHALPTS
jgi:prolyl oligopeptidase